MKKCLLIIDYQNDFVKENGKLTCGSAAQFIEPAIISKILEYQSHGDDVIFTMDAHSQENWSHNPESEKHPIHCIKGTEGAKLYGQVQTFFENGNFLTYEKDSFMLPPADIDEIIGKDYGEIEFAGVASNICVFQNVIGFYNRLCQLNKRTKLSLDPGCVASFDNEGHTVAIRYLKDVCGITVYTLEW